MPLVALIVRHKSCDGMKLFTLSSLFFFFFFGGGCQRFIICIYQIVQIFFLYLLSLGVGVGE